MAPLRENQPTPTRVADPLSTVEMANDLALLLRTIAHPGPGHLTISFDAGATDTWVVGTSYGRAARVLPRGHYGAGDTLSEALAQAVEAADESLR